MSDGSKRGNEILQTPGVRLKTKFDVIEIEVFALSAEKAVSTFKEALAAVDVAEEARRALDRARSKG